MVTNFSSPIKSRNSGSSSRLVNYLEKENFGKELNNREYFFNSQDSKLTKSEVIEGIDKNGENQGLKKDQDRFFTFTISPSQDELKHLNNDPEKLKAYTTTVMENYAKNFNRGIEEKDLVWFAKVEYQRHYTHEDKEVKEGVKERGQEKQGKQTHIHVIVSRFQARESDKERTMSLSPLTNHKGTEKGIIQGGFERTNFINENEKSFDTMFVYERSREQTFEHNRIRGSSCKCAENSLFKVRFFRLHPILTVESIFYTSLHLKY